MPQTRHNFSPDHDACGVGFIAQLGSAGSREVVERALTALARLAHRGGVDADGRSGDGAGLLTAIPESFIRRAAQREGIELPTHFGLGMVFLRGDHPSSALLSIERLAPEFGLRFLGWRPVPVDPSILGPRSLASLPSVNQVFFAAQDESYRESVLPASCRARVAVEAASPFGWREWVGDAGEIIGMNTCGASAPAGALYKHFGFTPERVADVGREDVKRARSG